MTLFFRAVRRWVDCNELNLLHLWKNEEGDMANEERDSEPDTATPEVDMTGLTMQQQEEVRKMLKEEAASFGKYDDDIECIGCLQMDIDLSDITPVQRNYVSIPRPLYHEVKNYIEQNN